MNKTLIKIIVLILIKNINYEYIIFNVKSFKEKEDILIYK